MLAADDLHTALDDILENAVLASGADFGNIQVYDPGTDSLEIVAQRGFGPDFLEHFRTVRVDDGSCCAEAMKCGERIIIEDVELDPSDELHRGVAAAAGYRAVQSTLLRGRDGSILGILSTHFQRPQGVSERHQRLLDLYARHAADVILRFRYEEDLRKREELLRLIHQIAKIGHWEWNSLTDENKWSPEIQMLYGLEPGTFAGTYEAWAKRVHPEDLPRAAEDVRQGLETGRYFAEFRVILPDGSVHWLEARANVFNDSHRRPVRIMGVNMDITERKRHEEALREADRRKDQFLATLAHELRNPLAPIRSAVEVLKAKGPPDPDLTWSREVIERLVAQMARLLDDLVDVSRITRNTLELRKERVTLATVVESAVETSRPVIDGGGHELTVRLPSDPVYLDADSMRLAQVFANLLNNAAKYTDEG